jgi:hypothetical protein
MPRHRIPAFAQDGRRCCVIPVVQYTFEQKEIAAIGYGGEEVALYEPDPRHNVGTRKQRSTSSAGSVGQKYACRCGCARSSAAAGAPIRHRCLQSSEQ